MKTIAKGFAVMIGLFVLAVITAGTVGMLKFAFRKTGMEKEVKEEKGAGEGIIDKQEMP